MRRALFVCAALLLPLGVLALDYTDRTKQFKDAPFPPAETAAINVLSNVGAIAGNPDGTFAPRRAVNRAEFLKIAFLSMPSLAVTVSDAANCFPDVRKEQWFSASVCLAKKRGVVKGYPDGQFHPERTVNYAEAMKMLAELYQGSMSTSAAAVWYQPYVDWAGGEGLLLPISLTYDAPLTRGQVSRLVASFLAHKKGELAQYRAQEQGKAFSSSSMSNTVRSSSAFSVSSASFTSAKSSDGAGSASSASSQAGTLPSSGQAPAPLPILPARSHFLVLGSLTQPIASATFRSAQEPVLVRSAQVTLKSKILSLERMEVIDHNGVVLGTLSLDPFDSDNLTWKGTFAGSGAYQLPQNEERTLAVRVRLKGKDEGGQTEQLVQADRFTITVEGLWSASTYSSAPQTYAFPKHQTTMGRITAARNVLPAQGVLAIGAHQLIASFSLSGSAVSGVTLAVETFEFQVTKSAGVAVSGWELRTIDGNERHPCSVSDGIVNCIAIPAEIGTLGSGGGRIFRLYGDVAVDQGTQYPFLQADLNLPGGIGENGAIRWTDGTGHFNWVELSTPVASGTRWQG